MSFAQVSYPATNFCATRLQDGSIGFNYWMTQTAPFFGVEAFQLSEQAYPPSLVIGRYDYPTLRKAMGANFSSPCAVLSGAKSDNTGRQNLRVTPSNFSGQIIISLDFYVTSGNGSNLPPNGQAMYHAVEAALVNTFNTPLSYGLMPPGTTYNNEVQAEQGAMEFDGVRWVQWIPCGLFFYQVS